MGSELESDLQHTVDWGWKWLVDFNAEKTQLASFNRSNNTGAIGVKMDGSVLEGKSFFKMLGLTFSSKLERRSFIISIAKTASEIVGESFFLSWLLCISVNLSYVDAWSTVVTSRLVLPVATWNF